MDINQLQYENIRLRQQVLQLQGQLMQAEYERLEHQAKAIEATLPTIVPEEATNGA